MGSLRFAPTTYNNYFYVHSDEGVKLFRQEMSIKNRLCKLFAVGLLPISYCTLLLWYANYFELEYVIRQIDATSMKLLTNEHAEDASRSRVIPGTISEVFFTIKTTPKHYERRIVISKRTWLQKVNRKLVRYM